MVRLIFQVKWAKVPQSSHRERDDDDDDDAGGDNDAGDNDAGDDDDGNDKEIDLLFIFLALLDYTLDCFDDDANRV